MSFRLRITIGMLVLVAVLFGAGGTLLIQRTFRASLEKEEQAAISQSRLLLRVLQTVGESAEWFEEKSMADTLERMAGADTVDAVMLRSEERVVYQQGALADLFLMEPDIAEDMDSEERVTVQQGEQEIIYIAESEVSEEPVGGEVQLRYLQIEDGTPYMRTTSLLYLNDSAYYLITGRDIAGIFEVRLAQIRIFERIFLVLVAVAAVIAILAATVMTRSLRKLSIASREIASGNLAYRSGLTSGDEVGQVARDFDQMAENLEQSVNELRDAAERQEMFMGAFTHELKTPMTSIIGYADLLRSQSLSEQEQDEALGYIHSEGKRLENLSLKLLELFVADRTNWEMTETDLAKLTRDVVEPLCLAFEKDGVQIACETQGGSCLLEPDLVRTLLINLLDNARKAMEGGGEIRIRQEVTDFGCRFVVTDAGKGIPPEAMRHLTEAFYRVDKARSREQGSSGLGLALCDRIVQIHGGVMTFASEPGEGTTVTVDLCTKKRKEQETEGRGVIRTDQLGEPRADDRGEVET